MVETLWSVQHLVHRLISNLLNTRLRGYDTISVLKFHVHRQLNTI